MIANSLKLPGCSIGSARNAKTTPSRILDIAAHAMVTVDELEL